jgi:organic hydroperoxide reductase OsmC/OhrA
MHRYAVRCQWTGNRGAGTRTYAGYGRDHTISFDGKPDIQGSSDPAFRGDASRHNPEELLVAALASCHMLWYLHLCSAAGIVVTAYSDQAQGEMIETADGGGQFVTVTLAPQVRIDAVSDADQAAALHRRAHELCFIARSVNFPVHCQPTIMLAPMAQQPGRQQQ